MLCRVRETFRDDVVGGYLELFRKTGKSVGLQSYVKGCDGHQRLQGDGEPVPADDRRMQAAGDVSQLIERLGELAAGSFQPALGGGVTVRLLSKHAEFEGQGNQTLLCTVVQVALQTPTLVLLGFDYPGT